MNNKIYINKSLFLENDYTVHVLDLTNKQVISQKHSGMKDLFKNNQTLYLIDNNKTISELETDKIIYDHKFVDVFSVNNEIVVSYEHNGKSILKNISNDTIIDEDNSEIHNCYYYVDVHSGHYIKQYRKQDKFIDLKTNKTIEILNKNFYGVYPLK